MHEKGDRPYDCGGINMNQGIQLLEAFNYAVGMVNAKEGVFAGKLGGLTIGGLGLDACQSATRAATLVSNIHAGYLPIMVRLCVLPQFLFGTSPEKVCLFKLSHRKLK